MNKYTKIELKNICKKKKIKGYNNLKKQELIKLINRKNRTKKLKKLIKKKYQNGGILIKEHKILGTGSFGWIVTPAVSCQNKKKLIYNKVSKFAIFDEGVEEEIKIGKKLNKIDKSSKYFLYVKDSCKINTKKVEKILDTDFTDYIEEMEYDREDPIYFYNLIMDKGDITIQEYFRKYNVGEKYGIKILIKLLKCIKILIDNGYMHTDFHNENVILKKTNKNKYEIVIIDFGDIATKKNWDRKEDFNKYAQKKMLFGVFNKVNGVQGKKFKKLLKKLYKVNTIKESFDIIKEDGYNLNMNLEIEKKDSIEKRKKKSFIFF